MLKSGAVYWLRLERDRVRQLLNLYQLGIDRVSLSRLGREPVNITQSEIERLKNLLVELNSLIDRRAG